MTNLTNTVRVAAKKDLENRSSLCAKAGDRAFALFQTNGNIYAIDNTCPHAGGPLCEGGVKDGVVTCPWHGSQFRIETGEVTQGPAKAGVKTYPVEIRGDDVYVVLEQTTPTGPRAVTFTFKPEFDKEHPFAHEPFLTELLALIKFPFKLYGVLPYVVIAQSADEIDVHLGELHFTEIDLLKMSDVMKALNSKWGVDITYCLFQSTQFPGAMLLNIRGPHAPMSLENTIKY